MSEERGAPEGYRGSKFLKGSESRKQGIIGRETIVIGKVTLLRGTEGAHQEIS